MIDLYVQYRHICTRCICVYYFIGFDDSATYVVRSIDNQKSILIHCISLLSTRFFFTMIRCWILRMLKALFNYTFFGRKKKVRVLESFLSFFFDTLFIILLEILPKFIDMYINLFRCSRFLFKKKMSIFISHSSNWLYRRRDKIHTEV